MNKVWLITGCSTGFGNVLARELLKSSEKVVATARNEASLASLRGIHDDHLFALTLDVTNPNDITHVTEAAIKKFGRIDVLVNNAGYGMIGAVEESSMDALRQMVETNVFGLIAMTQAVLPTMRAQKAGHIVNLSSVAGVVATPGFSGYNATKFAVEGLSESLALEVAHLGIKILIVEPGPFRTDFASRSLHVMPEITDYKDSVGKTRQYLDAINGNQPGDPVKAAHIIMQTVNKGNSAPLRLPLGNMAMDRIHTKIASWSKEMQEVELIARSADFIANDTAA